MRRNNTLTFICRPVKLRVENNETMFTSQYERGEIITIPIAHGEGNYYCDEQTLQRLIANNQIVFDMREKIQTVVYTTLQVL